MSSLKRLRLPLTQDWTKRMKPVPLVYFARIPARQSGASESILDGSGTRFLRGKIGLESDCWM